VKKEEFIMAAQVDLNSVYAVSEDVVSRDVHGEFVIVPIASGIGDLDDEIFSLNEFGRVIWEKLDGKKKLKEVAGALALQFEGDAAEIEGDILGLTEELWKRKMIVKI
jgi:hypothetical protein